MRYFLRFAYRGTQYHGSQSQTAGGTVQDTMASALATVLRCPVPITFAGRTDAGVHAEEMWAHIDIQQSPIASFDLTQADGRRDLLYRLNRLLPQDIALYELLPVTNTAHARFDATARTYHYRITLRKDPFRYELRTAVRSGLDFEQMNRVAQCLIGRQDFSSFCRVHTDVKNKFCTIMRAEWVQESDYEYSFIITADRFLRNMVRAIVGTLFEVGYGLLSEDAFRQVIAAQDRCSAGESAPAQGLFLTHVEYPLDIFLDE